MINVGTGPTAIALGDGSVWVANSLDGTVSRIDPQTDHVDGDDPGRRRPQRDRGRHGRGVGRQRVRPAASSRIDPATDTVARTITVGNRPQGLAVAGGLVWVGAQARPPPATAAAR